MVKSLPAILSSCATTEELKLHTPPKASTEMTLDKMSHVLSIVLLILSSAQAQLGKCLQYYILGTSNVCTDSVYMAGLQIGFSEVDYQQQEDRGCIFVVVFHEGVLSQDVFLNIHPLTVEQYEERGFVLPPLPRFAHLPDPAECKQNSWPYSMLLIIMYSNDYITVLQLTLRDKTSTMKSKVSLYYVIVHDRTYQSA